MVISVSVTLSCLQEHGIRRVWKDDDSYTSLYLVWVNWLFAVLIGDINIESVLFKKKKGGGGGGSMFFLKGKKKKSLLSMQMPVMWCIL